MKAEVKLKEIHTLFDVRGSSGRLDSDKVMEFALRIDSGEDLGTPILLQVENLPKDFVSDVGKQIPKDGFVVVDGRHRIEVFKTGLLSAKYQKEVILCEIRTFKTFADMLAEAGTQNDRPGTPLSRKEWKQNIQRMVGLGLTRSDILSKLQEHGMTKSRSEALWEYYRVREGSNTIKRVLNDVNLRAVSLPEAARKHRVAPAKLKRAWEAQRTYNVGKFALIIGASTRNWEKAMESEYKRVMELDLSAGDREQGRDAVARVMERMYNRIGNMVF